MKRYILPLMLCCITLFPSFALGAYPGQCTVVVYTKNNPQLAEGWYYHDLTINLDAGTLAWSGYSSDYSRVAAGEYTVSIKYFDNNQWNTKVNSINIAAVDANITTSLNNAGAVTTIPQSCPNSCTAKSGQSNYKLDIHSEEVSANLGDTCYEDCKTTAEVLWEDCLNGQCASSIKHTFTGEPCSGQPGLSNINPNPPERCGDELLQLITQCGGTLNVQSFNFETCTGECTPDSCQTEYAALLNKCGGFMGIATWDKNTCKGTCASDPVPAPPASNEKPPENIATTEKVNADGSKEVSNTTTYYNEGDGYTYSNTTTTTYDSSGNQTGQSTVSVRSPGSGQSNESNNEPSESFSSLPSLTPGVPYQPGGEINIPSRFNGFINTVKSSGIFSLSGNFFNSIPGGGSSVYTIDGGQTFGSHSIDFSDTMSAGLAILKTILLSCFGFLSIRTIIMKR